MFTKLIPLGKIVAAVICIVLASCASSVNNEKAESEFEVVKVRVPPFYDPGLTPLQNHYAFHQFLYPVPGEPAVVEVKGDTGRTADLPNDDTLLWVVLSDGGEISINSEPQASIEAAATRLAGIFAERQEMRVFVDGTDRVVKAVGIRIPHSAKYPELFRIVKALSETGADPVVLLLDGHLPYQPIR